MKNKKTIQKISDILNQLNSELNMIKFTGNTQYIHFNVFENAGNYFLFVRTNRNIFELFVKDALEKINLSSFSECLPNEEEVFESCSFLYKI